MAFMGQNKFLIIALIKISTVGFKQWPLFESHKEFIKAIIKHSIWYINESNLTDKSYLFLILLLFCVYSHKCKYFLHFIFHFFIV